MIQYMCPFGHTRTQRLNAVAEIHVFFFPCPIEHIRAERVKICKKNRFSNLRKIYNLYNPYKVSSVRSASRINSNNFRRR